MSNARPVYKPGKLARFCPTNATNTSFAARIPTTTKPTGTGVVDVRLGGYVPDEIVVYPIGTGDADDVFDMKLLGWRRIDTLWIPVPLVTLTCTLGTAVGVAGAAVVATEMFADTITAAGGISNVTYFLFSPTDNSVAHAAVKLDGCELVEAIFDATTGNPTGLNALWAAK